MKNKSELENLKEEILSSDFDAHPENIKKLFAKGIDLNARDDDGYPLFVSIMLFNGKYEVIKALLDNHANVNCLMPDNITPFMFACVGNFSPDIIQLLIEYGADINAQDITGNTALISVCDTGNIEIIKTLVKNGANKTLKNSKGKTAYDVALHNGLFDKDKTLELLLRP